MLSGDRLAGILFMLDEVGITNTISVKTPSGRMFKYNVSHVDRNAIRCARSAVGLATRVFNEKYKRCEWDRSHPKVDVEHEIVLELANSFLRLAFSAADLPVPVVSTCIENHLYFDMECRRVFCTGSEVEAYVEFEKCVAIDGSRWTLKPVKGFAYPGSADNHGDAVVEED